MKKSKLLLFLLCIFVITVSDSAYAAPSIQTSVEYLENGDYIETTITTTVSPDRANTRSGSKTSTYKNADGEIMWYITVKASFSYVYMQSAICTSVSGSSGSYSSNWNVTSPTTSKSGNSGTATATGKFYQGNLPVNSYSMSVTLSCDSYGNLL